MRSVSFTYIVIVTFFTMTVLITSLIIFNYQRFEEVSNVRIRLSENDVARQRLISDMQSAVFKIRFSLISSGYLINYPELYDTFAMVAPNSSEYELELLRYVFTFKHDIMHLLGIENPDLIEDDPITQRANDLIVLFRNEYLVIANALRAAMFEENEENFSYYMSRIILINADMVNIIEDINALSRDRTQINDEIMQTRIREARLTLVFSILLALLVIFIIGVIMISFVKKSVKKISDGVKRITSGNINVMPKFKLSLDFLELSENISNAITSLANLNNTANITNLMDSFVYATDSEYRLLFMNRHFTEKFNVNPSDYENKKCYEIAGRKTPCEICAISDMQNTGTLKEGDRRNFDFSYDSAIDRYVSGCSVVVRWDDDRLVYFHHFYDTTEVKEKVDKMFLHEKELENKLEQAEKLNLAKSSFIANTSLEVLKRLYKINKITENPAQGVNYLDFFQQIKSHTLDLIDVVEEIGELSRAETSVIELNNVVFDLRNIFSQCRRLMQPLADKKGIELYFYAEPFINQNLLGDREKLLQICINSLSSAIKHTDTGIVKFSATVDKKDSENLELKLEFRDSGRGMNEQEIETLFDIYNKSDSEFREREFTDITFFTIKKFVDAMGGNITVESSPGIGTLLRVELPFTFTDESESIGETEEDLISGARVLVLDENEKDLVFVLEQLNKIGALGVKVSTREALIKSLNEEKFDAVLISVKDPKEYWLEIAEEIRERLNGAVIYAIVANDYEISLSALLSYNIGACIRKPLSLKDLRHILRIKQRSTFLEITEKLKEIESPKEIKIAPQKESALIRIQTEESAKNKEEFDDDDFFIKISKHFAKNNQNVYETIQEALNERDFKSAHRITHNLKSNAGHIKQAALQEIARKVEEDLKNETPNEENLSVLKSELTKTLAELAPLLQEQEQIKTKKTIINISKATPLLDEIEPLLKDNNASYLDYLEEIKETGLIRLAELLDDFDAEAALNEIKRIRDSL